MSVKSRVATSIKEYNLKNLCLYWIIDFFFPRQLGATAVLVGSLPGVFNDNGVQGSTELMLASFRQVGFLGLILGCLNLSFCERFTNSSVFHQLIDG